MLSEQTATFWRAVDRQTFFVAADTLAKRRDYAPVVQRAILLPDSETVDEMTETVRVVRDIVGLQRTELNAGTHTLTVRDTPENVALAIAELVDEIQHAPGEVMLDVDVLEVDRNVAQQLGISPPTAAQMFSLSSGDIRRLQQAVNTGSLVQVLQSLFGGQNPLASAAGAASALIPPLIAFGGGKTLFLATLPGASADFSHTLNLVRQAQRVLLRAQDGRPATLFVGERYPITLAQLSASLATSSTQFSSSAISGSFPRTDYSVGTSPHGVAIGQFDTKNNAFLDLAVVNQGDNTVSILLGNGDGTFTRQLTDIPVGKGPVALVAGSFDSTSTTDNATRTWPSSTRPITPSRFCWATATTYVHKAGHRYSRREQPSGDCRGGNFDSNSATNNFPDLAVVNQGDNTISILLGNGDGTFAAKNNFAVGTTPSAIASADFNNDGRLDLAVTNSAANSVSVLLGAGDGTFSKLANDVATGNGPAAIATGNFQRRQRDEHQRGPGRRQSKPINTISILLGNGDGTFGAAGALTAETGPNAILSADFNNDGVPDLVVTNGGSDTVSAFLGLGSGTFAPPLSLPTGNAPVALAQGDVNGDGSADLAVVNQGSDSVSVVLNTNNLASLLLPNAALSPYPGSEYVDLGLKVHAVPRIHPNGEVTLDLEVDISSLAGQNVNGIPILTNRTINQTRAWLRENETSVLSGLMESSDMRSSSGWPGIGQIPILNDILSDRGKQVSDTELLIAITPRQLRPAPRVDRTFYAGRGAGPGAPAANQPPPPANRPPMCHQMQTRRGDAGCSGPGSASGGRGSARPSSAATSAACGPGGPAKLIGRNLKRWELDGLRLDESGSTVRRDCDG